MTNKAFQQYMDMFYRENPTESKAYQRIMNDFYGGSGEALPILHADSICAGDCNLGVFMHPYITGDHCLVHVHDCFELIYLSRGRCIQTIGEDACNMSEGDICILDPNVTHRVDLESATDQLFHIMIRPAMFQHAFLNVVSRSDLISDFFINSLFANDRRQSYLYFPHAGNASARVIAQRLIIELYEKKPGYQRVVESYLDILFTELVRSRQPQDGEHTKTGSGSFSRILDYINRNLLDVSLTSVAEEFHYHPKYLSSLFIKYTGKSFSEIVQDARLQRSCYYLQYTDLSVEEISRRMGYQDRSSFNRIFKRAFQMTPTQYRRQHRISVIK